MEIRTNQLEASSSPGAITTQTIPILEDNHPETISESRPIRSSARVRAAKQKAAQLSAQPGHSGLAEPAQEPASSSSIPIESASTSNARISPVKATRSRDGSSAKGKAKEDLQEPSRPSKRHVLFVYIPRPNIDNVRCSSEFDAILLLLQ